MTSLYVLHKNGVLVRAALEDIAFIDKKDAESKAAKYGCTVVEFREVPKDAAAIAVVRHVGRVAPLPLDDDGDTAAGALAAAEATIARLREELEQLRNRPSTHELAKRFLEATEG